MPRLKLTIAYVGTGFHGWQTQARKDKVVPTIQGIVEAQIARISGCPVHLHGAGRTDAGVHAEAQVAHVDVPEAKGDIDWQVALNTSLPPGSTTPYAKRTTTACGSPGATRRRGCTPLSGRAAPWMCRAWTRRRVFLWARTTSPASETPGLTS